MATVGRWTALTAFTPVRRWWSWWLKRLFWPLLGARPRMLDPLIRLSLIGAARWSLFDRVPPTAPRSEATRFPQPYVPFESNFNGGSDDYLEAFALVVLWGMRGTWAGAYGVPDMARVSEFERYVRGVHVAPAYYYCAYPDASAKMVRSALELGRRLGPFEERAATLDDERFCREYLDLLTWATRIRNPQPSPRTGHTGMLSILTPVADGEVAQLEADLARLSDGPPPVPTETTHFARWTVVPPLPRGSEAAAEAGTHLLFAAWFDGSEDDYLRELDECLGDRAEAIWGHRRGARDLRAGHVPVGLPFLGYDGVTVAEIRASLADADRFWTFAKQSQGVAPAELRRQWSRVFP
jgi:hypothetical protein